MFLHIATNNKRIIGYQRGSGEMAQQLNIHTFLPKNPQPRVNPDLEDIGTSTPHTTYN